MNKKLIKPKLLDVLFIVDVTGSMGHLIVEAQKKMREILERLSSQYILSVKVGLSLYRDHPDQDSTFVTCVFDLKEPKDVQGALNKISVGGGGDMPEAVIDGVIDGVEGISWREGSRRVAFLIGDAPAHGMCEGEKVCQCGKTWGDAVAIAVEKNVTIYSIPLTNYVDTVSNFQLFAQFTGGMLLNVSEGAFEAVMIALKSEAEDMMIADQVLELLAQNEDPEKICEKLQINRESVEKYQTFST